MPHLRELASSSASFARRATFWSLITIGFAASSLACTTPSSSGASAEAAGETEQAARRTVAPLSFGATAEQALAGNKSSFPLSTTPDLVLHATLTSGKYDGQTLLLRGLDPDGTLVWSYPHLQHGTSFDAVIPVFGSRAARNQTTGTFSFQLTAPDQTVVATGNATLSARHTRTRLAETGEVK